MFEVLRGKNGKKDCYINFQSIQLFDTYISLAEERVLKICMLDRAEVFPETFYEIDDFIDRMKRKEVMPV